MWSLELREEGRSHDLFKKQRKEPKGRRRERMKGSGRKEERQMGEGREEEEKKTELKLFYSFCSFWMAFSQEVDKRCRLLIN